MPAPNPPKHIFVNKVKYDVTADKLTGRQILALANVVPDNSDLFLVKGEGQSEQIQSDQEVEIKSGLHFNAITRGVNFG